MEAYRGGLAASCLLATSIVAPLTTKQLQNQKNQISKANLNSSTTRTTPSNVITSVTTRTIFNDDTITDISIGVRVDEEISSTEYNIGLEYYDYPTPSTHELDATGKDLTMVDSFTIDGIVYHITTIYSSVFDGSGSDGINIKCNNLTFPSTLKVIYDLSCRLLDVTGTLDLSKCVNLVSIGEDSLLYFGGEEINFGRLTSLETIGIGAFRSSKIVSVDLSKCTNLQSIGTQAFYNCTSLETVRLPNSPITSIAAYAFEDCSALTSIYFSWTDPSYLAKLDSTWLSNTKVTNIYVPRESLDSYQTYITNTPPSWWTASMTLIPYGAVNASQFFSDYTGDANIYFDVDESSNITITSCDPIDVGEKDLTMVSTYSGYPITKIGDNAFDGAITCKTLTLPDGLTNIGSYAFTNCCMREVSWPNSLTTIGTYAFSNCTSDIDYDYVYIDSSRCTSWDYSTLPPITTLDATTFANTAVVVWYVPTSVTSTTALSWVSSVATQTGIEGLIPGYIWQASDKADGVTSGHFKVAIMNENYESSLMDGSDVVANDLSIKADSKILQIYDSAFKNNKNLTGSLTLSNNNMVGICKSAFEGCTWITSVSLPNDLEEIEDNAFLGCHLFSITTPGQTTGASSWTWGAGVTPFTTKAYWDEDNNLLGLFVEQGTENKAVGCLAYGEINFSSGSSLPDNAFYGCSGINSVVFPDEFTSIGQYAFYGCNGLNSVDIDGNIATINTNAFSGCTNVTDVDFSRWNPSVTPSWSADVLSDFNQNADWRIPNTNVKSYLINWYNWANASIEHNLTMESSAEDWASGSTITGNFLLKLNDNTGESLTIFDAKGVTANNLTFSSSITGIDEGAFANNTNLTGNLTIPNTVRSISTNAFSNDTGFTKIDLTAYQGLPTGFANGCFASVSAYFLIPANLDKSKLGSWYDTIASWTSKTTPDVDMETDANKWAEGITSGTFELKIKDNTGASFSLVDGKSVIACNLKITDTSINEINAGAFQNNTHLTGTLTIPSTIGTIGTNAFIGCSNISSIDLSSYSSIPNNWANGCFSGLTTNFLIPTNVTNGTLSEWYDAIASWTGETSPNVCIQTDASSYASGVQSGKFLLKFNDNTGTSLTLVDGTSVFANNLSINSDSSIVAIGEDAFTGNTNLTGTISIPTRVTDIGVNAFSGCNNIDAIDLSSFSSVPTSWANGCFNGLDAEFLIPANLDKSTLSNWYNAIVSWTGKSSPSVDIQTDAQNYADGATRGTFKLRVNGVTGTLTLIDGTDVVATNLMIKSDSGIIAIGDNALENNRNLSGSIQIPTSITTIGANALNGCTYLNEIRLNWSDLSKINALNISKDWLGGTASTSLNRPETTILVPDGMVEVYQAVAADWGMDQCTITDGTTPPSPTPTPTPTNNSNLGLILGLSLGIGIPVLAGSITGIVVGVKKNHNKKANKTTSKKKK